MLRIHLKSLVFLFLAYNLFLAAVLFDVLAAEGTSAQTTISFSDSDFGSATPPPTPPVRISKPFYEASGVVLSFNFEQYAVNNVTRLTMGVLDCGACEMVIVALSLSPPPSVAKNGTILLGASPTYDVNRSDYYVLIYDTRTTPSPCEGQTSCNVLLSGAVSAASPVLSSPYAYLPAVLAAFGILAILPPAYWTFWKQKRANPAV